MEEEKDIYNPEQVNEKYIVPANTKLFWAVNKPVFREELPSEKSKTKPYTRKQKYIDIIIPHIIDDIFDQKIKTFINEYGSGFKPGTGFKKIVDSKKNIVAKKYTFLESEYKKLLDLVNSNTKRKFNMPSVENIKKGVLPESREDLYKNAYIAKLSEKITPISELIKTEKNKSIIINNPYEEIFPTEEYFLKNSGMDSFFTNKKKYESTMDKTMEVVSLEGYRQEKEEKKGFSDISKIPKKERTQSEITEYADVQNILKELKEEEGVPPSLTYVPSSLADAPSSLTYVPSSLTYVPSSMKRAELYEEEKEAPAELTKREEKRSKSQEKEKDIFDKYIRGYEEEGKSNLRNIAEIFKKKAIGNIKNIGQQIKIAEFYRNLPEEQKKSFEDAERQRSEIAIKEAEEEKKKAEGVHADIMPILGAVIKMIGGDGGLARGDGGLARGDGGLGKAGDPLIGLLQNFTGQVESQGFSLKKLFDFFGNIHSLVKDPKMLAEYIKKMLINLKTDGKPAELEIPGLNEIQKDSIKLAKKIIKKTNVRNAMKRFGFTRLSEEDRLQLQNMYKVDSDKIDKILASNQNKTVSDVFYHSEAGRNMIKNTNPGLYKSVIRYHL